MAKVTNKLTKKIAKVMKTATKTAKIATKKPLTELDSMESHYLGLMAFQTLMSISWEGDWDSTWFAIEAIVRARNLPDEETQLLLKHLQIIGKCSWLQFHDHTIQMVSQTKTAKKSNT